MTTHPPASPADRASLSLPPPELPEDEEYSPQDPASLDVPVLFVRLLDENLQPRRFLSVEVESATSRQSLCTDSEGVLFCDGCDPGVYTLSCQRKDGRHGVQVHTITLTDLEEDHSPYIAII